MTISFTLEIKDDVVILRPQKSAGGLLGRWKQVGDVDLTTLPKEERDLAYALARVRSLDPKGKDSVIRRDSITLTHNLIARLDDPFAGALGLPPLVHELTFAAKLNGSLGSSDAKFNVWWERNGRRETVSRRGAILFPDLPEHQMRLPAQIYEAFVIAKEFDSTAPLEQHWRKLAEFRNLFGDDSDNISLDRFLDDLRIVTISRIGLEVMEGEDTLFAPVPYAYDGFDHDENQRAALAGPELDSFQLAVEKRGAQPAYRLADGAFAVVDRSAAPVLRVVADSMHGNEAQRRYFVENAPKIIADAVEEQLRQDGRLDADTSPETLVDLVEKTVNEGWAETPGWSDRVFGVGVVVAAPQEMGEGTGLPWLTPTIEPALGELLGAIADDDVASVLDMVRQAIISGQSSITCEVGDIPATGQVAEALERRLATQSAPTPPVSEPADAFLPLTHDNFWDVDYTAGTARRAAGDPSLPVSVTREMYPYQTQAFNWQVEAWTSGLPGVLNADEQGLGKTLQTLSFLAWLSAQMDTGVISPKPILVVAPTSLLRNWEDEIKNHLSDKALGPIHKLYGPALSQWRTSGVRGRDIGDGNEHLDFTPLANTKGVVITTYQTLANYAVSIAQLPFGVVVFDEMQFVKNPRTQRARAAKSVNAEFSIGLTGTPVENATRDIWAILDIISPGALGALSGFRRLFDKPSPARMAQLRDALFEQKGRHPKLCQRNTKVIADPSIPSKTRLLYPRDMPAAQAIRYDEARAKTGGILQILQHIRRISAHPGLIEGELSGDFAAASARTQAVLDILALIKSKGERALIFVENRDIQSWFIEVLKLEFDLPEVMLINGDTTIDDRKDITDRFQNHLKKDGGFDILMLGPRSAGTGLTLTAANHVIHLTRWWNPAVEAQCNDRTHRIGQKKPVTVHIPLAIHPDLGPASFDCLLHQLMMQKTKIASNILQSGAIGEHDIKRLHDAVVSGSIVDDVPNRKPFDEFFPGHEYLITEKLAADLFLVKAGSCSAAVLIGASKSEKVLKNYITDEVSEVIVINPTDPSSTWNEFVPLCRITNNLLWPKFVLPD